MLAAEAEAEAEKGASMLASADEAEGKSELASDGEGEGEGEAEAEAEGKREVAWERRCRFRDCLCPWEHFTLTRRVAPGTDYFGTPGLAGGLDFPAWSLLVGVSDGVSSLQVSRLHVARSGRILGRSDDLLDVFHKIDLAKPPRFCFKAGVARLPSDARSLCLLHNNYRERPQALQLSLHSRHADELPLPEIQGSTSQCIPISADGQIWALSAAKRTDDIKSFSVLARRLVTDPCGGRQWECVDGGRFTSLLKHYQGSGPEWKGAFLQGYAVIPDANLILVSFQQYGLFLTFAPDSSTWTEVLTDTSDEKRKQHYLPIFGRGIYVEQHKAVFMLQDNIVYAYRLIYQNDDQGKQQLKLDLPIKIDKVCPFIPEKGYGFLTRLANRRLCSVWISLAWHKQCPCKNLHAIVTTFDLLDPAQGGMKVLHSTYRRIDMVPNLQAEQKFCFLQEYEDSPLLQQHGEEQEDLTTPQHVDESSKILACCRIMLDIRSLPSSLFHCYKDDRYFANRWSLQPEVPSSTIPPLGPSRSPSVDPASSQHQVCSSSPAVPVKPAITTIKKDLFIICQAGSRSVIYQTGTMDDNVKRLELCDVADVGDHDWHLFQSGSKICAVSSKKDGMLELSLNNDQTTQPVRRPTDGPFVMVIRVGQETIALTDTLHVYHQTQFNDGSTTWLRYMADDSDIVRRRVDISGYVAVDDHSFIVCDAVTCSCLQFELEARRWRVVMPFAAFKEDLPKAIPKNGYLNGRCVFVDGFIYTCINGGLAAYELLDEDYSVYLSKPILLPLSRHVHFVGEDMCFDYAGKDVESGANLFHVVQVGYSPAGHGSTFHITTFKVKTERTATNKMKPAGTINVGTVTRFTHHTEAIKTRCCFAVSS